MNHLGVTYARVWNLAHEKNWMSITGKSIHLVLYSSESLGSNLADMPAKLKFASILWYGIVFHRRETMETTPVRRIFC